MSYEHLPAEIQLKLKSKINEILNNASETLQVSGQVSLSVSCTASFDLDLDFNDVQVAERTLGLVSERYGMLKSTGALATGGYSDGPHQVLHITPSDVLSSVDLYDMHYRIVEDLDNRVEQAIERAMEGYGDAILSYVEVSDIDVSGLEIENQDEVDEWNKGVE